MYTFRTESEELRQRWVDRVKDLAEKALKEWQDQHKLTEFQKVRLRARHVHDSEWFQSFFGLMILLSFFISLVQTEMVPKSDTEAFIAFEIIDVTFTSLFTLELVITMVAFAGQVDQNVFSSLLHTTPRPKTSNFFVMQHACHIHTRATHTRIQGSTLILIGS